MEINNPKITNTNFEHQGKKAQGERKSDINYCPKDIDGALNTYAYIGQSMVKKYSRPPQPPVFNTPNGIEFSAEDLKPIKLVKNKPISDKEKLIAKITECGITNEQISWLDLTDNDIINGLNWIIGMFGIAPQEQQEEFKKSMQEITTPEELKSALKDTGSDGKMIYYNKENYNALSKYCEIKDIEDFLTIIGSLADMEETTQESYLAAIPYMASVSGKLERKFLYGISYNTPITGITAKRSDIIKQINSYLPQDIRMSAHAGSNLGDDKELTPENINKYLTLLSRFSQDKNIDTSTCLPGYRYGSTMPQLNEQMELISEVLDKFPMELENDTEKGLDIDSLYQLFSQNNHQKLQETINTTRKEAKSFIINKLNSKENKIPTDKLVKMANSIFDPENRSISIEKVYDFVNENSNEENIDDIIDLIELFKGTDKLGYYADSYLKAPQGDYKSYKNLYAKSKEFHQKGLHCYSANLDRILKDPNMLPDEVEKIMDYQLKNGLNFDNLATELYTQEKGYNKFVLLNKFPQITENYYSNYYKEKRKELLHLAEKIENQEELDFCLELLNQKMYPDDEDYNRLRFGDCAFNEVGEVLDLWRTDKETIQELLNKKFKNGSYILCSVEDLKQVIEGSKIDPKMTNEFLDASSNNKRYIKPEFIKELVEATQIDKDFTLELINKPDPNEEENSRRKEYAINLENIKPLVTLYQLDKEFATQIINMEHTDLYGYKHPYLNSTDKDGLEKLVQHYKQDPEFVKFLVNSTQKDYQDNNINRFNINNVIEILENTTDKNKDFVIGIINKENNEKYGSKYYYSADSVTNLTKASNIDIELTQGILNNNLRERYFPSNNYSSGILELVKKSETQKDLVLELTNAKNKTILNENFPRFEYWDILNLLDKAKDEPSEKFLRTLLNEKNYDDRPYYSGSDILYFMTLRATYGEENVEKYRTQEEVNNAGNIIKKYHRSGIENLLYAEKYLPEYFDLIEKRLNVFYVRDLETFNQMDDTQKEKICELMNKKIALNGKECYRFEEFYKAMNVAKVYEQYPEESEEIDRLLNFTQKDHRQIETARFTENDIENMIYIKESEPEMYETLLKKTESINTYALRHFADTYQSEKRNLQDSDLSKNNIEDMTKKEKRTLISLILKNKNQDKDLKNLIKTFLNIPLLPTTEEEYIERITELGASFKISQEPASKKEQQELDTTIFAIADNIKTGNDTSELAEKLSTLIPQFKDCDKTKCLNSLAKILNNEAYNGLSKENKKLILLSALLQNIDSESKDTEDSAFDAFFIAKRFGLSDSDAQKIYTTIESSNIIDKFLKMKNINEITGFQDRGHLVSGIKDNDLFDLTALKLRNKDDFSLAKLLYSSHHPEKLTRYFDKLLEHRINEIKSNDFVLPQTTKETMLEYAETQEIVREDKKFNVKVVHAKDIPNFYGFTHTVEAGFTSGGGRKSNFANFEVFETLNDDRIICTCYLSAKKPGPALQFQRGFLFNISNDNQFVGYGRDIYSHARNKQQLVTEYYRDKNLQARGGKGEKYDHRTMISDELKDLLFDGKFSKTYNTHKEKSADITYQYNIRLKELEKERKSIILQNSQGRLTYEEYKALSEKPEYQKITREIKKVEQEFRKALEQIPEKAELDRMNQEYITRVDKIKKELGTEFLTLERLQEIDSKFAKTYEEFFSRNASDNSEENRKILLRDDTYHNEVLISNPTIAGIFTADLANLPDEYLEKAEDEGLPIVIFERPQKEEA